MQTDFFKPNKDEPLETVIVHFDGGARFVEGVGPGYGDCYGSYAFNGGEPVRVEHGIIASANTAELLTLCVALEALAHVCDASRFAVMVWGDSRIALKWAAVAGGDAKGGYRKRAKISKGSSEPFRTAIQRLSNAAKPFARLTTEWKQRQHAVRAFGH